MNTSSIWTNYLDNNTKKLNGDISTNVLIVGGGICGVLQAFFLKQNGVDCILVEKDKLGNGITKNTTAVLSAQQEILYMDRIKKVGFEAAKKYLYSHLHSIELFKELSKKYNFDFEEISCFIYNNKNNNILKNEYELLSSMGYKSYYYKDYRLDNNIYEALEYKGQAQINPIKLINELSKEIDYYTNTDIIDVKNNIAYTNDNHKITFKRIVYCTHFPPFKLKGLFSLKMYQKKSFVVSFETEKLFENSYVGLNNTDMYFRCYKNNMIIGANDCNTGCLKKGFNSIIYYIKKNFKDYHITNKWINQDCITLDDMPYIGRFTNDNSLYIATGFNMWGMTSSMISAEIITDLILKRNNIYEGIYNPKRKMYKKQLFINIKNSMTNVFKFSKKRCTHLGSALYYNEDDNTYECPCHGSKYSSDGKLLSNPAKNDL